MLVNPQTSSAAGLQKVLYVLEVLKTLPAGDVIYQQVEQVLSDYHQHQSDVERAYHAVTHALLDAYYQQLDPESPLAVQVKMLQRRLQPPVWPTDMELIKAQVDLYADHILASKKLDQQQLQASLASLLSGAKKQDAGNSGQTVVEHNAASADTSARTDEQIRDDRLSEDINNSISQNQEFGVILELMASELKDMEHTEGMDVIRDRMVDLVGKMKNSHGEVIDNLHDAVQALNHVEGDKSKLDEELQRVRMLSMTDELTELPNRRAFLDRLDDEVGRVNRHHVPLTLALIDLDEFKHINDVHGHAAGDEILRCYAENVFNLFRQYDMVARYGGEEFAVLLPNTDQDGALCALVKAMDRVKGLHCKLDQSDIPVPSFSAGIAAYHEGEVTDNFIDRADQALYRAKSLGRNRVEISYN